MHVSELACGSCTLLLCTRNTHTPFTAAVEPHIAQWLSTGLCKIPKRGRRQYTCSPKPHCLTHTQRSHFCILDKVNSKFTTNTVRRTLPSNTLRWLKFDLMILLVCTVVPPQNRVISKPSARVSSEWWVNPIVGTDIHKVSPQWRSLKPRPWTPPSFQQVPASASVPGQVSCWHGYQSPKAVRNLQKKQHKHHN